MNTNTTAPAGVVSSTELGLLPIGPHDHPEPRTMMWSALELAAIKEYAARCVTAERERWKELTDHLRCCRECSETDVAQCPEGASLWMLATGNTP